MKHGFHEINVFNDKNMYIHQFTLSLTLNYLERYDKLPCFCLKMLLGTKTFMRLYNRVLITVARIQHEVTTHLPPPSPQSPHRKCKQTVSICVRERESEINTEAFLALPRVPALPQLCLFSGTALVTGGLWELMPGKREKNGRLSGRGGNIPFLLSL